MRVSQLVTGVVLVLAAVSLVGALVTLVLDGFGLATVVVLVVAVVAVGGGCAVGARSRRWLSNPYW